MCVIKLIACVIIYDMYPANGNAYTRLFMYHNFAIDIRSC